MSGYGNQVNNNRVTPGIFSDALVNRPLASKVPRGTIFVDQTTPQIQQQILGSWQTIAIGSTPAGVILQGGNAFGVPVTIGSTDNQAFNFKTNNITRASISNAGAFNIVNDLTIGTTLTVTGNTNFNGNAIATNANRSLTVGNGNTFPAAANAFQVNIGIQNTIASNALNMSVVGVANTVSTIGSPNNGRHTIMGYNNTLTNGAIGSVLLGDESQINNTPGTNDGGTICIGRACVVSHAFSSVFGLSGSTTATNQLIFANAITGSAAAGYNEVYFSEGVRSISSSLNAVATTINATGAGNAADRNGGNLVLAAGKGTGVGTGGDLLFKTATAAAAGSTLQSLTTWLTIKYNTGAAIFGNTIQTADPGAGAGAWQLGKLVTAAVTADTTRYIQIKVDGTTYKVIIST